MHATLTPQDVNQLAVIPTENMAAYREYLRAVEIRNTERVWKNESYGEALERAIELDPLFTRAMAELVGHFDEVHGSDDPRDHLAYAKVAERTGDPARARSFAVAAANGGGTPTDLVVPYRLEERATGSDDVFVPMEKITGAMPNFDPMAYLRIWKWEADQILLIGATQAVTVRIEYERALPSLSQESDPIEIPYANRSWPMKWRPSPPEVAEREIWRWTWSRRPTERGRGSSSGTRGRSSTRHGGRSHTGTGGG